MTERPKRVRKDCSECGPEPKTPQGRPVIRKIKTKILPISELTTMKTDEAEKAFNVYFNMGYRPVISNNAMIVLVKEVQIPIKGLKGKAVRSRTPKK